MADSDEYGDEFDDTAFLVAATQAEKENTPVFQVSPRPTKRRKVDRANERTAPKQNGPRNPFVSSDEDDAGNADDWTLPEDGVQKNDARLSQDNAENENPPARATVAQQRRERIHVPTTNLDMKDVFFTQPPEEHSPPWKPRGAIWAKSTTTIGIHKPSEPPKQPNVAVTRPTILPNRQSPASRSNAQILISSGISNYSLDLGGSPKLTAANGTGAEYDFSKDLADLPSDAFSSPDSSPQRKAGDSNATSARQRVIAPQAGLRQTTLFGREGANGQVPVSQVNKRYSFIIDQKEEPPTHHKLNPEAMKTWVYPTNLGTIRDYQFNIVQRGLFNNLLVALPTGLGKTFIAATIMLNWYRWTTEAQIIFVAPTKPLVSQQIEACYKIAGIPRSATTMLIGGVSQGLRAEEWKEKRVFFMTPQTLMVDLKAGYVEPKKIVLLVVDEAHRATGAYAYVEIVSFLRRFNSSFRVLALTATPGADVEAVQKVIDGLDISKVEIRTENSMDICSYVHQRKIEKHVFQNSDEMEMCMDLYSKALQPLTSVIAGMNAYWSSSPIDFTPFGCQQARAKYLKGPGLYANAGAKATVHSIFSILASISHGMDLLKYHGMASFYIKMKEFQEESTKTKSKYKKQILDSDAWKKLMIRLHGWVNDDKFVGHPKLEFVQQVILDHFMNAEDGRAVEGAAPSQTRIMVFAHFRDSAEEIAKVLKRHDPMIRPRVFVGQSHGKNSEGMSQKEQLAVIEKFKEGTYNTLIATSIGEEGLDIGEVDLIICYDSKASPIRMLQRMGRTGRKREGKIVMLQMQGKEENDANKAKDSYEKMQEIIANGSQFNFHDEASRRILPPDVRPTVDRRIVDIPPENSQVENWLPEPKKGRKPKKPPKKFHMPDDVLTGFVKAGNMDEEIKPKRQGKKAAAPVYPSEELVDIPSLESVILDEKLTTDLERRYQTVFDDDDAPIIGALDLGAHYDRQRTASRTVLLAAPGRASRSLVSTMQRMHQMDEDRLDSLKQNLHYSDCESDAGNTFLVSDAELDLINEDMWADDDPASQTLRLPKTKAKPGPKPKAKPKTPAKTTATTNKITAKTNVKTAATTDAMATAKTNAKTPTKPAAPRGRPPGKKSAQQTPVHPRVLDDDEDDETPAKKTRTPNWRVSGLAQEGDESSPPPTDPRNRIASQADTIGSDDTLGDDEVQDTQAYLLDSELASFIVEDEDDVEIPASSLPSLDLSGIGRGTQAVVQAARSKRQPVREKIFTSDATDDDAVVSSDSDDDDDIALVKPKAEASKKHTVVLDDTSSEEEEPMVPKKRVRRVIEDDEDDDE